MSAAIRNAVSPDVLSRLARIRHLALDMDGTIYKGSTLFPTTLPFLKFLNESGIGYTFLTNNPSKSLGDYLKHLHHMGIEASVDQMYISTQATVQYLRTEWPAMRRLFVLGTDSMRSEFAAAGYELTTDSPEDEPDAVVVGFDMTLTYARLCRAAWWIQKGKPFVATNPDRVCPTDQPTVLVDCGSICAALKEATGRAPTAVMGKPDPTMLTGILERHSLRPEELAMIGDRLYTDIAMAHRAGAFGVLVLTGESNAAQAERFQPAPDLTIAGLTELGELLRAVRMKG